ncbi:OmpA family protein [Ferruginibacter yonginensis]|uniref:OmpA family protein n=1 Tax=Ferruginibacter yonginensis TaxID=1310416 RepID=A0ABV8QU00_9BACT
MNNNYFNIKSKFIYLWLLYCCSFLSNNVQSQNLFANADFEAINNCTEYHQDCSSEAWFYLKPSLTPLIDARAVPKPFSGKDLLIVPVENVFKPVKARSYVYTMFCCPLQKGKNYKLSFYINTGGKSFYGIDFYMRSKEFTSDNFSVDTIKPSIHIDKDDIINEFNGWNYVETVYKATGTEKFCLVGNLQPTAFEFSSFQRMNKGGDVFYFIDDIAFTAFIKEPLCKNFQQNVQLLFAQNLRHTEKVLVEPLPTILKDTITISAVFFEIDKAILKPSFKLKLDSLAKQLEGRNIQFIEVEGHTDATGSLQRNTILSQQRATSVQQYLVAKLPSFVNKISAQGFADTVPVADNTSTIGKAKNRRVQIIISYLLPYN